MATSTSATAATMAQDASPLVSVLRVPAPKVHVILRLLAKGNHTPQKWHLGNRSGNVVWKQEEISLEECIAASDSRFIWINDGSADAFEQFLRGSEGASSSSPNASAASSTSSLSALSSEIQEFFRNNSATNQQNPFEVLRNVRLDHGARKQSQAERNATRDEDSASNTVHPELLEKFGFSLGDSFSSSSSSSNKQPQPASTASGKPAFTFVELFAGIGGFRLALEKIGGHCILASELEADPSIVYLENFSKGEREAKRGNSTSGSAGSSRSTRSTAVEFPECQLELGKDVRLVHNNESTTKSLLPHIDLLVGGFPCQPFSALGEQPGLQDEEKGLLFQQIVRFLKLYRPKSFLLENVPGLLTSEGGDSFGAIMRGLQTALDAVEGGKFSYNLHHELVDARGVTAGRRNRVYIVGYLVEKSSVERWTLGFDFPFIPDLKLSMKDVLEMDNGHANATANVVVSSSTLSDKQFMDLQNTSIWKKRAGDVLHWPEQKCGTLVSHYGHHISNGKSPLVPRAPPLNPRALTPRECARVMGFGEEFLLETENNTAASKTANSPSSASLTSSEQELMNSLRTKLVESLKKNTDNDSPKSNGTVGTPDSTDNNILRSAPAWTRAQYRMLGNAVCPPLIAALAGAVIGEVKQREHTKKTDNNVSLHWRLRGCCAALELAFEAVAPYKRTELLQRWRDCDVVSKFLGMCGGEIRKVVAGATTVVLDDFIENASDEYKPKRRRLSENDSADIYLKDLDLSPKADSTQQSQQGEAMEVEGSDDPSDKADVAAKKKAEKARRKQENKERKKLEKKQKKDEKKSRQQNMRDPRQNNGRAAADGGEGDGGAGLGSDGPELTFRLVEVEQRVEQRVDQLQTNSNSSSSSTSSNNSKLIKTQFIQLDPYEVCMTMFVKRRMLGRELLEVFTKEFVKESAEYYRKAILHEGGEGAGAVNGGAKAACITVNGQKVEPDYLLKDNDKIEHLSPGYTENLILAHPIKILHERPCRGEEAMQDNVNANGSMQDSQEAQDTNDNDNLPGLLVVEKPAGLPVHPAGSYRYLTLTKLLARRFNRTNPNGDSDTRRNTAAVPDPRPLHRLDKFTSGIVVLSREADTAKKLTAAFIENRVKKTYLCRVTGDFREAFKKYSTASGTAVPSHIQITTEDPTTKRGWNALEEKVGLENVSRMKVKTTTSNTDENTHVVNPVNGIRLTGYITCRDHKVGKYAFVASLDEGAHAKEGPDAPKHSETSFYFVKYCPSSNTSIVVCEPVTGRTHQIRVHLLELGYPIANDPCYNPELEKLGEMERIRSGKDAKENVKEKDRSQNAQNSNDMETDGVASENSNSLALREFTALANLLDNSTRTDSKLVRSEVIEDILPLTIDGSLVDRDSKKTDLAGDEAKREPPRQNLVGADFPNLGDKTMGIYLHAVRYEFLDEKMVFWASLPFWF